MSTFITEPVMLHHSTSLLAKDDVVDAYPATKPCFRDDNDDESDDMIIDVPQNLEPEQFEYEFPPKSRLQALARLYNNDYGEDSGSFFDESSFTTTSTMSFPSHMDDETDNGLDMVHPGRPLSRPATGYTNDHLDRFFDSVASAFDSTQPMVHNASWYRDMSVHDRRATNGSLQDEAHFVTDNQLPPLQLPACSQQQDVRSSSECRSREQSCDSAVTVTQCKIAKERVDVQAVTPSSFLSVGNVYGNCQTNAAKEKWSFTDSQGDKLQIPRRPLSSRNSDQYSAVFQSEAELQAKDYASDISCDSKMVLIRLSRKSNRSPVVVAQRCATTQTWYSNDEGYDDEVDDEKEPPIQSVSTFYDLSDQEQRQLIHNDMLRTAAAVKIQAAWRGYRHRKAQAASKLKPTHRLIVDMVRLCANVHHRQMVCVDSRIRDLECHLREETAMRIAFEKAMEDMAILVDQQQKMLYDRLEQEISMRQVYERQMQEAMAQVKPLTAQLQKEAKARGELESMMACVLDQMEEMKLAAEHKAKEEALAKKTMQRKLDDALAEMASLKRQLENQRAKTPVRASARPTPPPVRASSAAAITRPSALPARPSSRLTNRPTSRPSSRRTTTATPSTPDRERDVKRPATSHATTRTTVAKRWI